MMKGIPRGKYTREFRQATAEGLIDYKEGQ